VRVSVVIATHQGYPAVLGAIGSALRQSSAPLEVVVVDDGSTDGTASALAALGDRIRCLRVEHGGPARARHLGVQATRGELVAFLDHDDRWRPCHLATLLGAFERFPEAVLAAGGQSGQRGPRPRPRPRGFSLVDALPRLLIGNFVGFPSSVAVRREALIAAGGFRESLRGSEGYDLWLRLGLLGSFVLAGRRTTIKVDRAGSLGKRARAQGRLLAEREQIGRELAAELRRRGPALARAGESYLGFVTALRALERGEQPAAAAALRESCRLMPERSLEPWLTGGWLGLLPQAATPEGKLRTFQWAARSWPQRDCDTALGLRLHAALLAARARRPATALQLLAHGPTLRFAARAAKPAP
jgi:hypothetical protein